VASSNGSHPAQKSLLAVAVGISVPLVVILLGLSVCLLYQRRRRIRAENQKKESHDASHQAIDPIEVQQPRELEDQGEWICELSGQTGQKPIEIE